MANSLRRATKKATYEANVSQLDNLGIGVGSFDTQDTMTVVESIIGDFILRVQDNINNEKDMVTTGSISDISIDTDGTTVNVYANPHLIYQDRGVNGWKVQRYDTPHRYVKDKRPPLQPFLDWVKAKQSFLTDDNENKRKYDERLSDDDRTSERPFKQLTDEEKRTQVAWAISTKVHQQGFKPSKIYSKEIPQLVEDLGAVMADFTLQQINQVIDIKPRDGGENRIIINL